MTESAKAALAIQSLAASGLSLPFGFNEEQAVELWAGPLAQFPRDDITAAVGLWIMTESKFPTLEQFLRSIQKVVKQRKEDATPIDGLCPECGDPPGVDLNGDPVFGMGNMHVVRVVDGVEQIETFKSKRARAKDASLEPEFTEIEHHHYRPCSLCCPEKYDLYRRGHWDAGHDPCQLCRKYRRPGVKELAL